MTTHTRQGRLSDKVVVIIGAGSGIGRAVALRAAHEGAALLVADVNADGLEAVATSLRELGVRTETQIVDVRQPGDCARVMSRAVEELGGLDGVVCTAGIAQAVAPLDMTLEQWERMLAVHLTGAFLVVQAAARTMVSRAAGGSIITFASSLAMRGDAQQSHYAAAKAGVIGLTKSYALEVGRHGIRCNAVAPGLIETPMLRGHLRPEFIAAWSASAALGRVGQPEDIADGVCFLLSDDSRFMTGQTLHLNGGNLMP